MVPSLSETEFKLFRRFIKKHVGISFSDAKKVTLQRKLSSRLRRLGLTSYNAYYRYLLYDKKGGLELRQLINTITVEETAFFRNPKQLELLASIVLPEIAARKNATKKLRIWCAGCSTGQEAYSIAVLVSEMFDKGGAWDFKILATDIDTDALKFAHKGKYPMDCAKQIPLEYLNRYFKREAGKAPTFFVVKDTLKKNLLFRRLNFASSDFHFKSPVDIVLCRNVMIYFDAETKKKLIDNFFRIMHQDGFLCLGAAESLIGIDERFILVGRSIYQRKG